jgi:myo-inositol-1-phosphate synthase
MSPATEDQRQSSLSLVHSAEDKVVYCVVLLGSIVDVVVVPAFGVVEGAFGVVETVLFFFPARVATNQPPDWTDYSLC